MKKLSYWIISVAALAVLLSACSPKPAEATVQTTTPAPRGLIAEGRLQPVNSLDQSFSLPGKIAEILVADGEQVETGQPLAGLVGSPDAQAALARAEQEALAARQALELLEESTRVNLAQSRLAYLEAVEAADLAADRYEADDSDENQARLDAAAAALQLAEETLGKLEDGEGVDPAQRAALQARITAADAAVASARALLDAQVLSATLEGTIVDLSLQSGQQVLAGTPVMTIADLSAWVVKTDNLTELDIAGVEVGQAVDVVLDALPDISLAGEVSHINARYEEKRGDITYTVTVQLQQSDPRMRWGMTAAVYFQP